MSDMKNDLEPIVSELAEDEDMVDLVEMFIDELPQRVTSIRKALEEKDFDTLGTLAHQLKGAGGGYGFPVITLAAKDLEHTCTTDRDLQKLTAEVEKVADLCSRARATN